MALLLLPGVVICFVVPSFRETFRDMGTELPVLTRALFNLSDHPTLVLLTLGAIAALVIRIVLNRRGARRLEIGLILYAGVATGTIVFGLFQPLLRVVEVPVVHFVLPPDFRGAFVLRESPDGQPFPEPTSGRSIIHVPASGHVLVDALPPGHEWLEASAGQQESVALPRGSWPSTAPRRDRSRTRGSRSQTDEGVRLYRAYWIQDPGLWYWVGTRASVEQAVRDRRPRKRSGATDRHSPPPRRHREPK